MTFWPAIEMRIGHMARPFLRPRFFRACSSVTTRRDPDEPSGWLGRWLAVDVVFRLSVGVLTGLAKRTLKGVEVLALTGPEDLPAARDLLSRHGGTR